MSRKDGIGGAVAPVEAASAGSGQQLDLLGGIAGPAAAVTRRGGRPPGAKNRKTAEMIEYLERRYASPLEGLAKTWTAPTDALAKELGCSMGEAFDKQQAARVAALRYWHQALSPDVAVNVKGFTSLQFITGAPLGGDRMATEDLGAALEAEMEKLANQTLNKGEIDDV